MGGQLKGGRMTLRHLPNSPRRGITVLALLLLIIAVVIVAVFLVRYLQTGSSVSLPPRPAATSSIA
jgi:hypothetical protein